MRGLRWDSAAVPHLRLRTYRSERPSASWARLRRIAPGTTPYMGCWWWPCWYILAGGPILGTQVRAGLDRCRRRAGPRYASDRRGVEGGCGSSRLELRWHDCGLRSLSPRSRSACRRMRIIEGNTGGICDRNRPFPERMVREPFPGCAAGLPTVTVPLEHSARVWKYAIRAREDSVDVGIHHTAGGTRANSLWRLR